METDLKQLFTGLAALSEKLSKLESKIEQSFLNLNDVIPQRIKGVDNEFIPSRSKDVSELFAALSKAQAEMQPALLSAENPYFKSRYADLTSLVQASRPALTKNGLAVIQQILPDDNGSMVMHTLLTHSSGQYITSRMRIIPPKSDIQSLGSHITYLRRFSYASIVGIVTQDEDDDGETSVMSERQQYNTKGPSVKYDATQKEQKFETITKDQLDEINYELSDPIVADLAEEIMDKMRIQTLADLPKSKYRVSIERIREIKNLRLGQK